MPDWTDTLKDRGAPAKKAAKAAPAEKADEHDAKAPAKAPAAKAPAAKAPAAKATGK